MNEKQTRQFGYLLIGNSILGTLIYIIAIINLGWMYGILVGMITAFTIGAIIGFAFTYWCAICNHPTPTSIFRIE